MPINDIETYRQKELNLQDPTRVAKAGPANVSRLKRDMASFRSTNPHLFQGAVPLTTGEPGQELSTPEGIAPGSTFARDQGTSEVQKLEQDERARVDKSAIKSGYSIDLTQDQTPLIEGVRQDPNALRIMAQIESATRDDALPNASKLKVFADPPDYEPKSPPKLNPLDPLASRPKRDDDMWHEPTVDEFRGALTHGALANKLKAEFPNIEDPTKLIDKDLEASRSFQAYRDMAWRHALSQAMKESRPLHRVAYSAKLTPEQKALAQGFDTASSVAGGALQAITLGMFDPIERLGNPTGAERNRQSRLRNPKAEMAGEVGGSLVGGPAALAKGAANVLGKKLGTEGFGALATGVASGAATGAVDTTMRQIAQGAADALDAGDSAVAALKRIYETLNPTAIATTAGMGAAGGLVGDLIGSGARAGARGIVSSGERGPILQRNLNTGGKMTATGNVKLEPQLDDLQAAAAANRTTADDVLAERSVDPIASEQLLRQEAARRAGTEETELARARLTRPPLPRIPAGPPVTASPLEVLPRPTKETLGAHADALSKNASAITPEEAEAVRRFSHGYDESIRKMQRGATDDEIAAGHKRGADHAAEARASQEHLESYIRKTPPATEIPYVYRGIVVKPGDPLLSEGTIHADPFQKAVTSASADPLVARSFVARNLEEGMQGVVLKLKHKSAVGTGPYASEQMRVEKELLLPGNAKFRVVKRYRDSEDPSQLIIEAEETAGDIPARRNVTVPTRDTADKIDALAADMPKLTNEGVAKARKLKSIASKLREVRELDAAALDKEISGLDDLAKNKGQKSPDKDLVAVSNFLRELRDDLKFPADEATEANTVVDNFAIRDPEGKVKVLGDYSGMKARQYKEQSKAEFENDQLGLPRKLKAEPMELGDAPGEEELMALAEGKTPKVQMTATERGRARDTIRSVGDVDNLARSTAVMDAGERAGVGGNLKLIQKLRDRQDWKKLLGEAFSGISVGPGRIGNKFLSANQMLRAVPTLKSLSGGLPNVGKSTVEASDQLVNLLDKALSEAGGAGARKALGNKIVDEMVPELGLLNLRGGQGARGAGAANRKERDSGTKLTDEEREVAMAVIRNLQNLYGDERKAQ